MATSTAVAVELENEERADRVRAAIMSSAGMRAAMIEAIQAEHDDVGVTLEEVIERYDIKTQASHTPPACGALLRGQEL